MTEAVRVTVSAAVFGQQWMLTHEKALPHGLCIRLHNISGLNVYFNTLIDRLRSEWGLFVGCLTSQQHASVSQGRICSDNFTCCHTEIEAADQSFHLSQSQYTDTGPTSPSADPITPGAWQGSHWSANF